MLWVLYAVSYQLPTLGFLEFKFLWVKTYLTQLCDGTILQEFLRKRAYPLFRGCAQFFVNWLVEDGKGHLVTNPSTSPEHYFIAPDGQRASVSYGSTMDMAILKNLFNAVISAAKVSVTVHVQLPCIDQTRSSLSKRFYYCMLTMSYLE